MVDGLGHGIQLTQPAKRIISLAPDITETLFAIGAGQQLVGVLAESDYPAEAAKIKRVGTHAGIDMEAIAALKPDLIVVWGHLFSASLQHAAHLGIPIYHTLPKRLEDVPRTMRQLGCLTGHDNEAGLAAAQFSAEIRQLERQYRRQKPIKVFYQIGDHGWWTVNHDSWINQVITLCGGHNVFEQVRIDRLQVDWEAVLAANPEVILSDSSNPNWVKRYQTWTALSAVKLNHLYTIDGDLIDRSGPRLTTGAKKICDIIVKTAESR